MARKKIYIGSVGPYLFDDEDLINDQDGDFAGDLRHAMTTNKQIIITEEPTDENHLLRLGDADNRILAPMEVVDINDPSAELAGKVGIPGTLILVYQINATRDEATLYAWETANSDGVDIPYVVAGSSGFWIATAGYGLNINAVVDNIISYRGVVIHHEGNMVTI